MVPLVGMKLQAVARVETRCRQVRGHFVPPNMPHSCDDYETDRCQAPIIDNSRQAL